MILKIAASRRFTFNLIKKNPSLIPVEEAGQGLCASTDLNLQCFAFLESNKCRHGINFVLFCDILRLRKLSFRQRKKRRGVIITSSSSTSTLMKYCWGFCLSNCSKCGATCLQGPAHVAKKKTSVSCGRDIADVNSSLVLH